MYTEVNPMRFALIQKETIITPTKCVAIRILAITDKDDYKKCELLGTDTVKLQRMVGKNKFDTFATAKNLHKASSLLTEYIGMFTYGQKYVRL